MPTPPHTVPATTTHTHTMILLHGLGSSGPEFKDEFLESKTSKKKTLREIYPNVRWVFPTAPFSYPKDRVTPVGYSWFDIVDVANPEQDEETQEAGLAESARALETIVRVESRLVGSDELILLGGISQGCVTALNFLLRGNTRFGGFVGFCGWLPSAKQLTSNDLLARDAHGSPHHLDRVCLKTPVLLQHSEDDEVVPIRNGEVMRQGLERLKMRVFWQVFATGGHWIVEPEGTDALVKFVDDVAAWKFV